MILLFFVPCKTMSKIKNIYDDDILYRLLHLQTAFYVRHSFKRFVVIGKENIPEKGAIIFTPNHCNTLMDPLAMLASYPEKIVFVARADIFNSKFAGFLNFLKIMPINRRRDGLRSVLKTDDTIAKSIEVLKHDTPFCILPEGTHRTMHSLLPIGKGIARIAIGASEVCEGPLYIVPIGLEYGDYFRYRSTLVVHYGKAIDVKKLLAEKQGCTQLEINNTIRNLVGDRIKENIVYLPDDQDYWAMWELSRIWSSRVHELDALGRWKANREAAAKLSKLREDNPQKAEDLFSRAVAYREKRMKAGISMHVAGIRNIALWTAIYTLMLVVFTPFAAIWAIVSSPVVAFAEFVCKKGDDLAFNNSLRCAVFDFLWTFLMIVWTIVLFIIFQPLAAVVLLILIAPAPFAVYDYVEAARRTLSCWRLLKRNDLRQENRELYKTVWNFFR